jgi:hypothetical protein
MGDVESSVSIGVYIVYIGLGFLNMEPMLEFRGYLFGVFTAELRQTLRQTL